MFSFLLFAGEIAKKKWINVKDAYQNNRKKKTSKSVDGGKFIKNYNYKAFWIPNRIPQKQPVSSDNESGFLIYCSVCSRDNCSYQLQNQYCFW